MPKSRSLPGAERMHRDEIPAPDELLCPSTQASTGAALIGVVGPDGRVGILGRPLPVDEDFLDNVSVSALLSGRAEPAAEPE